VKALRLVAAALVLAAGGAMLWQHLRYLEARRSVVDDRQPILYGGDAFHVISFLRVAPGEDVLGALRALRAATEGVEGAQWIYAGKVALTALSSSQLGEVDWSAVIVVQYPSQAAYRAAAATEGQRAAFARFAERYSHGFARPRAVNLLLPQFLLARRAAQLASFAPSHFPFAPAERLRRPEVAARVERLLDERELGARAAVVVNLTRRGTAEQQASDRSYGWRMLGAMAEGGYGPMHMGRAVAVEGDHDFDSVAIVYYPGVEFFHEMANSEFFQGIIGDKALGDAQASITVPVLSRL
jgi:hypothetical protein